MRHYNIILPVAALAVVCAACDDDKMEWGLPDGHEKVDISDIPLTSEEIMANYDFIRNYAQQYWPNAYVGLGASADLYISNADYRKVADDNFQLYTTGNAMKMGSMVKSNGTIDYTTVDNFLELVPSDKKIYGHNFIWHTQQPQDYLKSVIAPEMKVVSDSESGIANVLTGDNSDFEGGTKGNWSSWGDNKPTSAVSDQGGGHDSDYCLVLDNPVEGDDYYKAQCAYTFDDSFELGETYVLRFYAKTNTAGAGIQFAVQNSKTYTGEGYANLEIGTDWTLVEHEYTCSKEGMNRILISFGKTPGTYYIDDVKWGVKNAENKSLRTNKGTTITYVLKTAEQKKAALDNAMELWIKSMFEHVNGDDRFVAWDVINEPIADGGGRRGIDGVFGGSWTEDDVTNYDAEPTESETEGLKLNWCTQTGNKHFYWGYYMGMDYAYKAFTYARKYADENGMTGLKLFVNDYNLETNPAKLAELISFVSDIDNACGGSIVDGIGTQMHITCAESDEALASLKEKVDAMFKTMAATGKLVRVTELDCAFSKATTNPSSTQLSWQSKTYQMVFESYVANVPEAQRHGITIWTLSDNEDEHEYWLNGDSPNIFDASYNRKEAYRGVCDGIAGMDISTTFSGDDWVNKYKDDETSSDESDETSEE